MIIRSTKKVETDAVSPSGGKNQADSAWDELFEIGDMLMTAPMHIESMTSTITAMRR
ncbi:MAG: hypothetical protein AAF639_35165 [Chloroflexota bacterium]